MTEEEALSILGLEKGANEEIKKSYYNLMKKFHLIKTVTIFSNLITEAKNKLLNQ